MLRAEGEGSPETSGLGEPQGQRRLQFAQHALQAQEGGRIPDLVQAAHLRHEAEAFVVRLAGLIQRTRGAGQEARIVAAIAQALSQRQDYQFSAAGGSAIIADQKNPRTESAKAELTPV